ncbi:MAG: CD225/dispanin family protein [Bacteroidaceae bacterium]|nr:CD225/dispanin family protein [Bacteroidaceae bacterium]
MNEYYFITPDNKRGGPVLPEKFAEKGITEDTLIWKSGMADWTPAGMVDEVKAFVVPQIKKATEQELSSKPNEPISAAGFMRNGVLLPKPDNGMLWAILSTICCCIPLGIVAIYKASKVNTLYYLGQYEEAVLQADSARRWALAALITGILLSVISNFSYFMTMPMWITL